MCYCTVFALYSFEFEGNFRVQACGGCGRAIYRWVLRYEFFFFWGGGGLYLEGLIHGGAYFRNFTVYGLYKGVLLLEGRNPVQVTQL